MIDKILFSSLIILHSFSLINCQVNNNSLLERYKFNDSSNQRYSLDESLNEISGLADAGHNFVYAHNDEKGIIFKIELTTGKIVLQFSLGEDNLFKDFEGIACVNDTIYLTTSNGTLYRFKEGENNQSVKYEEIKPGLKQGNDIEGLCYDSEKHSLLLACKNVTKRKKDNTNFKKNLIYQRTLDQWRP